ncbi:MAG TPA: class I SAM-dependent methyltransferase [Burkholderiales bacterium]|nr:class I SAM-dependent methyltransferase [Burkholderiales bacterium]
MGWDAVWERVYREREWGRYPQEEVVRFVARNFYRVPDRAAVKMLEIGCGPGSGASWFVAREGYDLTGIDASPTAIDKARERFSGEGLPGEFVVGPVDDLPFPTDSFDAVIDVVCLACNPERETRTILGEVHRVLKPGGLHFSLTPRSGCWGDEEGERIDRTTLREVRSGPFAGLGTTRFATRESLVALYGAFRDLAVEHTVRSAENGTREITHWLVTCRK